MTIGQRLRQIRKTAGLTLKDVSDEIGIFVSFLSDLERGRTKPSYDTLEQLALYYGMYLSRLFEGVQNTLVAEVGV